MRSSGGDTVAYLREKVRRNFKLREEELKLIREELELNKQREQLLMVQSGAIVQLTSKLAAKFWLQMEKVYLKALFCIVWLCLNPTPTKTVFFFLIYTRSIYSALCGFQPKIQGSNGEMIQYEGKYFPVLNQQNSLHSGNASLFQALALYFVLFCLKSDCLWSLKEAGGSFMEFTFFYLLRLKPNYNLQLIFVSIFIKTSRNLHYIQKENVIKTWM